jgi:hypothetical protein
MKTSNKWLLAALLLLLGSLTAYNMGLRAEYRKGAYKDPKHNTTALDFKDFNEVDVQAASAMSVKIVRGPYGVRLNNAAKNAVKISRQGARLTVALAFAKGEESLGSQDVLTISCPQLKRLTASGTYLVDGKPQTQQSAGYRRRLRVEGFSGDSLLLRQDHGAQVELAHNQLGYLQAEAGRSPGSHSGLLIEKNNRIGVADLRILSQAALQLDAGGLTKLRTQFGDSARATLTGAGLNNLGQR